MVIQKGNFRLNPKIKAWMKLKGWTQRDFALQFGVAESAVSRWFDEKEPLLPSLCKLRRIGWMTGLDPLVWDYDLEVEVK